ADIVIIQALSNSVEVGVYSAAVKMSEMLYFAPNAFMSGVFPAILRARASSDTTEYRRVLQHYIDRVCWLGIAAGISISALSSPIILILFGGDFVDAVPVLALLA